MMEKGGKLMSFRFAQHCLRCGWIGKKFCMNCSQNGSKRSAHVALVFVTYFVNPTIPVFFIVLKTSRVFLFIYKIKFARARDAQVGTFAKGAAVSSWKWVLKMGNVSWDLHSGDQTELCSKQPLFMMCLVHDNYPDNSLDILTPGQYSSLRIKF